MFVYESVVDSGEGFSKMKDGSSGTGKDQEAIETRDEPTLSAPVQFEGIDDYLFRDFSFSLFSHFFPFLLFISSLLVFQFLRTLKWKRRNLKLWWLRL